MNKLIRYILFGSFVCALFAFSFFLIAASSILSGINVSTKEIKYDSPEIKVSIKVPVISGMPAKSFQDRLNATFESTAFKLKDDLIAGAKQFAKDVKEAGQPLRQYQLFVGYKVTYNKNGILSFYIETYQFTGGAHGMTDRDAYNINVKTGEDVSLKDLFKNKPDLKGFLNEEIKKEIEKRPQEFFTDDEMEFKSISDDQPFYIAGDAVVIYFPLYEIAPYSSGIPEFRIGQFSVPSM